MFISISGSDLVNGQAGGDAKLDDISGQFEDALNNGKFCDKRPLCV